MEIKTEKAEIGISFATRSTASLSTPSSCAHE